MAGASVPADPLVLEENLEVLETMVRDLSYSHEGIVKGVMRYVEEEPSRYLKIRNFLDTHPGANAFDLIAYIEEFGDYHDFSPWDLDFDD